MNRFSFTVQVSGPEPSQDDHEDRLLRAGYGDGLVAVIEGKVFVDFDREARSYDIALASARMDIEKAGGQVVCRFDQNPNMWSSEKPPRSSTSP